MGIGDSFLVNMNYKHGGSTLVGAAKRHTNKTGSAEKYKVKMVRTGQFRCWRVE
jgi:hypothetical protein